MLQENPPQKTNRKYKDSFFRHLFTEDISRLQELFQAASGKPPGQIELVDAWEPFFSEIRNDIVFLTENRLVVFFEHQSTWSDNLPLRFLWYASHHYRKHTDPKAPYRKKRILLPTPEFYLFYNGKDKMPERFEIRLSDSFQVPGCSLELLVTVFNVNYDAGCEIFQRSVAMTGYSRFVAKIRELETQGMSRDNAIQMAIEWCIRHDVLTEYMKKHGRWVKEMFTFEYDAELAKAAARDDGYEEGLAEGETRGEARGEARGRAEGESRLSRLMSLLLRSGKNDEATAAVENAEMRKKLYEKYGIA